MTQKGVHLICEKCSRSFRREAQPLLSAAMAYSYLRAMASSKVERLVGLYLNTQGRPLRRVTIAVGTVNRTAALPREIFRPAILCQAVGVILAHNHPSGSLTPSQDDVAFSRAIAHAGQVIGIQVYDHLIVSRNGYASLKDMGLI